MQDEWTEKYRPQSLSQIIGNESSVRAIHRWADSWAHGTPRTKAIVLRGEPGVGKTSAALALAHDMGWDFIEMNASDHRNAASIRKVAGMGSMSQTFSPEGEFLSSSQGRRKLVIIDEADNLFGREDYGGAKAIVETIRESGQPIVLLVNDYYELSRKAPAIKSLAESVTFRPLDSNSVVNVLRGIAQKEGINVPEKVFEKIAENANGDMRAAVNDLQMMVEGRKSLHMDDAEVLGKRNQLKELDEALRKMFGAKTLKEARDATLDIDETPEDLEKWVEDGIVLEMRDSEDLASSFDALSRSDIYLARTRRLQYYGFWSYAKDLMTGGVALSRKGGIRPQVYEYRFPSYFIMLSRARGPRAARESAAGKLAPYFHTSNKRFNEAIRPLLGELLRRDEELLATLIRERELDEGDVSFLLGVEPDALVVAKAMERAKGETIAEDSKKRLSTARRTSRSLADF